MDGKANGKDGRPNAPIRIIFAMRVLKEGCGCSDESLYEQCRYNLLFRAALGLFNLSDSCPSIDTYYGFYRSLCKARVFAWTANSYQAISHGIPATR
jgi:hypothetical protein